MWRPARHQGLERRRNDDMRGTADYGAIDRMGLVPVPGSIAAGTNDRPVVVAGSEGGRPAVMMAVVVMRVVVVMIRVVMMVTIL